MRTRLLQWLCQLPTTNARIATSILLAALYVLVSLAGAVLEHPVDATTLYAIGGFLLIMMGLDVAQYSAKRITFRETAPDGKRPGP